MSGQPAQTLATHLLNQTLGSIAVLESLNVLNASDAHLIRSKLPSPTGPFPSLNSAPDLSHSFGALSVNGGGGYHGQGYSSPPPPVPGPPSLPPRAQLEQRARALWDYHGAGDTLIIDEEVNEQWYRGRVVPNGQSFPLDRAGLFPSNYVEKIQPGYAAQQSSQPPPQPQQLTYQQPPQTAGPMVAYQTTPSGYGYEKQQYQQAGVVPYNPPAPPAQPQYQQQQQQQQQPQTIVVSNEEKKSKMSKIGGQLGHAAVNGAGFGFGASIASDLVNKIF